MKRSCAALKTLARESLTGQYGTPVAACVLIGLFTFIPSMFMTMLLDTSSTFSIVSWQVLVYIVALLVSLLQTGYNQMFLNLNRKIPMAVGNLFYPFSHHPDRFLVLNIIILLAGVLPTLPLDIMSYQETTYTSLMLSLASSLLRSLITTVLSLFLGLADYLLLDNDEMGAMEAMRESLRLMKGNKGRCLYMQLSFLPLTFVCMITCYVGFLWLTPYMNATFAYFYMDITGELDHPRPEVIPPQNPVDMYY